MLFLRRQRDVEAAAVQDRSAAAITLADANAPPVTKVRRTVVFHPAFPRLPSCEGDNVKISLQGDERKGRVLCLGGGGTWVSAPMHFLYPVEALVRKMEDQVTR